MKKLMCALAAVAAGVAFAEEAAVQSAEIVGYANTELRGGKKIVGAAFQMVGSAGMDITELKVTGYENDPDYKENGIGGGFELTVLKENGGISRTKDNKKRVYVFCHDSDGDDFMGEPYWWRMDGNIYITEKGVEVFAPGEAIQLEVAPSMYTEAAPKFSLVHAGEAEIDPNSTILRPGKAYAVSTLSAATDMSDISITGYENDPDYKENGIGGGFELTVLKENGGISRTKDNKKRVYVFCHDSDGDDFMGEPYWWRMDGNIYITEKGVEVFQIGEGFQIEVAPSMYTEAAPEFRVVFPGIDE